MFSFLGQVIPDLLKTETTISNLLSFTLHALSFLSQLDPDHLKNSIDEETIDKGYNGVFQLFGGDYVKIMFSGFQNYFQTLTKEEQVPMFRFMGNILNISLDHDAMNYSCDANTVDLRQLIELSPKNYYQSLDSRITSFVDAAAATQQNND